MKLKQLEEKREAMQLASKQAEAEAAKQVLIKQEEEAGDDLYGQTNYAAASSPMKFEKKGKQQWVP